VWHERLAELGKLGDKTTRLNALVAEARGRKLSARQRLALKLVTKQEPLPQSWEHDLANAKDVPQHVSDSLAGYADSLQRHGALLCSLVTTRFCCNNPYCSSMATASEGFLLVRGQSCVCGGCLMGSKRPTLAPTFCTAAR
jgi:hypothetical protein